MQQVSEYEQQALDFLAKSGLEFRAVLIGDDCPTFCEDARADRDMDKINTFPRKTHIHGKHYRCTISGKDRGHFTIDYWNSYRDEEENYFAFSVLSHSQSGTGPLEGKYWDKYRVAGKFPNGPRIKKRNVPKPYDVLACIQKYDPGTLSDFCSELGYSEDSKRDEQIYLAVCKEFQKVRKFFTEAEIEALQEIN